MFFCQATNTCQGDLLQQKIDSTYPRKDPLFSRLFEPVALYNKRFYKGYYSFSSLMTLAKQYRIKTIKPEGQKMNEIKTLVVIFADYSWYFICNQIFCSRVT